MSGYKDAKGILAFAERIEMKLYVIKDVEYGEWAYFVWAKNYKEAIFMMKINAADERAKEKNPSHIEKFLDEISWMDNCDIEEVKFNHNGIYYLDLED